MEQPTSVNGVAASDQVWVACSGLMVPPTKASGRRAKLSAMENLFILTMTLTKVSGRTTRPTDGASSRGLRTSNSSKLQWSSKVSSRTTCNMGSAA